MIVCSKCQMVLHCSKNEVDVRVDWQLVRSGDEYTCPGCGLKVATGFGRSFESAKECAFTLKPEPEPAPARFKQVTESQTESEDEFANDPDYDWQA